MSVPPISRRRALGLGLGALGGLTLAACAPNRTADPLTYRARTISYGPDPLQTGDLKVPIRNTARPVVLLVHGGYWRPGFDRTSLADLADDLAVAGYASWNIDYRVVGSEGGGWPGTPGDVATAIDLLAELADEERLDLSRVAVLGHSAGGQLASWLTVRDRVGDAATGGAPRVRPRAVVSLAGVSDLVGSAATGGTQQADDLRQSVLDFLGGGPDAVPDRYQEQSPLALTPLGVPQFLLHGTEDDRVPLDQSRRYVAAASAAGDDVRLVEVPGVGHFQVIEATSGWWSEVLLWLETVLGPPSS